MLCTWRYQWKLKITWKTMHQDLQFLKSVWSLENENEFRNALFKNIEQSLCHYNFTIKWLRGVLRV